jgi:hypothetical protein
MPGFTIRCITPYYSANWNFFPKTGTDSVIAFIIRMPDSGTNQSIGEFVQFFV